MFLICFHGCLQTQGKVWKQELNWLQEWSPNQEVYVYIVMYISIWLPLEKAMAPHSSTLAWKIPWMEEPSGLQSMGSWRVRHDWATSFSLFTFMDWRGKWQPTPVFIPGESQGQQSLVGCHLWGRTESDTTEATQQLQQQQRYIDHDLDQYSTLPIQVRMIY